MNDTRLLKHNLRSLRYAGGNKSLIPEHLLCTHEILGDHLSCDAPGCARRDRPPHRCVRMGKGKV